MAACLHIGWPKTGTTYIQEWLKLNKPALGAAAISAISSQAAHRLGTECLGEQYALRADVVAIKHERSLLRAVSELYSHGGALSIISSEYFSIAEPELVTRLLTDAGIFITKVVCYLRRQDRLCASGYAQEVKTLGVSRRITEVLYNPQLDWEVLHERWSRAFPRSEITFLNYDMISQDNSLVASFAKAIGAIDLDLAMPPGQHNQSLTAEMTEVARLLNEREETFDPARLERIRGWYPGLTFGFTEEITRMFEERFIESNKRFAERVPGGFDDFAQPGWLSPGIDMTGRVTGAHLVDIVSHL